jgi:hypothetical protein
MSSAEPTHIYYDLEIANQALADTGVPPNRLSFTQVRSSAILDNPNDYFMSIVRFSLDTAGALPSFIPQIDLEQLPADPDFPNQTVYEVTLGYQDVLSATPAIAAGIFSTYNVVYIPHSSASTASIAGGEFAPPTTPLTIRNTTTNYYWVQNINQFIQMINDALRKAWVDVVALVNAAFANTIVAPNDIPPYLSWDDETNRAVYWAPLALANQGKYWNPFTTAISPALQNCWFNAPLHILFSSFEYAFQGYSPPQSFLLRVYERANVGISSQTNVVPAGVAPISYPPWVALAMGQAFSTGPTMTPITSIIFTTSLLPVLPSLLGVPQLFSGSNFGVINQDNNNIINTVTDLEVNLVRGDEYLPNVIYEPTAEYRLLDLQSNAPLSAIQISVVWKDIFGQLHDFYLQNGCGATLKVMFRKKAYNNIVPFMAN